MNEVIAQKPTQIFLMIGTNDLCYGRPVSNIVNNYRAILNRFHTELPTTKVYVQSVLPFNETLFPSSGLRTNSNIQRLNVELRKLATEYHYPYIDLASHFTGPDGQLPPRLTSDGLHLSSEGYIIWREQIKELVKVPGK